MNMRHQPIRNPFLPVHPVRQSRWSFPLLGISALASLVTSLPWWPGSPLFNGGSDESC